MNLTKWLQFVVFLLVATASGISREGRAERPRSDAFPDAAAIEKWAKQSYFGGAQVEQFPRLGRELVVVNGMPTSGLLTSQLVVFGRGRGKTEYHVILKTAVLMDHVRVSQDQEGLTAYVAGKAVLRIPFELLSVEVQGGL
jgi:hypothetical protein